MKPSLASHLHDHTYPPFLLRHPQWVRLLHAWNCLVLQRNWATRRWLRRLSPQLPPGSLVVDAGCADGLHLFSPARRFPHLRFLGVDKKEGNIAFCRKYVERIITPQPPSRGDLDTASMGDFGSTPKQDLESNAVNLRKDVTIMGTRRTQIGQIYTDNQRASAHSVPSVFPSSSRTSLKLAALDLKVPARADVPNTLSPLEGGRGVITTKNHVHFLHQNLEELSLENEASLLLCIGTLQYIGEDVQVLRNFARSLTPDGRLLLYVPVNGRMVLPLYRRFFHKMNHYENSQHRQRVYTPAALFEKLETAGLAVRKKQFTYGAAGILGHEIYSLLLLGMGNAGGWGWVFGLLMVPALPVILLLKGADFILPKKNGNGCLVVAGKTRDVRRKE
jgi:SAM-dependent methyltransferase